MIGNSGTLSTLKSIPTHMHFIQILTYFGEDQKDHIYIPQLPLASSVNYADEQSINHQPNLRHLLCFFFHVLIVINKK